MTEEKQTTLRGLPPDPDNQNEARALHALAGADEFFARAEVHHQGINAVEAFADLISALGHCCDRLDLDLSACIELARDRYSVQTAGQGRQL